MEAPEEFLARLLPSSTPIHTAHRIWMYDLKIDPEPREHSDVGMFKDSAYGLLNDLAKFKSSIEKQSNGTPNAQKRRINQRREELTATLKDLATASSLMTGKWLLFPEAKDVDDIWALVVRGIYQGKLGPVAKVSTGGDGSGRSRVICVYTHEFSHKADVKRILLGSEDLGLVQKRGRQFIYYKADAWTHLDVDWQEYGLRASIYWSREVFDMIVIERGDAKQSAAAQGQEPWSF